MLKEVVIISGKGGTGKTSLVGALSCLAENKVMVDCDVDAADLHLILTGKTGSTHDFISGKKARILPEACTECGICADYCRFDAVKYIDDPGASGSVRYLIDEYACEGCGVCVRFCPDNAIELNDVVSGQWFVSDTKYGHLAHARLGIAQSNSGKLVSLLREQARGIADEDQAKLILIDGPPGIGCPVISSLTGANFVLMITEPTLSAIHDLTRLLELTEHFDINAGLVINKCDINDELAVKIEAFAASKGIKVLGKIPYDNGVTKAQIAAVPYPEYASDGISGEIIKLWENLKNELNSPIEKKAEDSNRLKRLN